MHPYGRPENFRNFKTEIVILTSTPIVFQSWRHSYGYCVEVLLLQVCPTISSDFLYWLFSMQLNDKHGCRPTQTVLQKFSEFMNITWSSLSASDHRILFVWLKFVQPTHLIFLLTQICLFTTNRLILILWGASLLLASLTQGWNHPGVLLLLWK